MFKEAREGASVATLVKLHKVNKIFKTDTLSFHALIDINLEIKKGEFIGIVGPSGSGKSTLMNILGLLDNPTSGTYTLDGQDVSRLGEETLASLRNKKIGFIFQNFNLLGRTSALENVQLPLIYSGVSKEERDLRAVEILQSVGLGDKLQSRPNQLSGGQQQRVAVARALITNPEILLADEPTGNLDSKTGADIINLFKTLNKKGKTIILITHEASIAKNANRVITIKDGKVGR
ncbi:MAG: putative ABC transport system ATP-binding protein [Microgenomates group bacterium Gr01-1014_5]|nr:MAG: putative ABC transport system ATP-binding protein [Microgenomates group bacterium Gr01-1014_5]